jgi:signal transduction histidine kinase
VNELIRYALTLSRSEWKYCATITLSLSDDLPQLVCVPSALSQVILNLLTNAAHAIQDASGNSPRTGEIKVSTRLDEDSIEITISDTGCGIPLALQEKVFEPFFTTKKAGRGSGQGLALARSIVTEQHKGSLTLKSAPGEGTTFTLRFPLE